MMRITSESSSDIRHGGASELLRITFLNSLCRLTMVSADESEGSRKQRSRRNLVKCLISGSACMLT